ncbi:MFS transporter [Bacillus amyloliquefaciens]|uniref:MFS transporter n=3 Tax=Bacillus amyloliquefaciens group TaxID=1938374 RepID=UPI0020C63634|nr:MFS transporter [Bacillus amyloliquefaciens]MEC1839500.1 MFS transporter [Bacillus amyloliquefaciens]MEC2051123.1 MFS transporter [Bacillus amyloliquefaciens]
MMQLPKRLELKEMIQTSKNEIEVISEVRWKALAVISIIQFILLLDATVVNVALPHIKQDLGFTAASLTWVVNAYLVAAGSLLLLGGRIGDAFGLRRTFQIGIAVFGVFSLVATLSSNASMLIVGRAGQGVGEALTAATGLAMVSLLFPSGPERGKAFSIWAALGGFGSIVGVMLSGVLTEYLSWRWVFGINIPIILILYVTVVLLVPKLSNQATARLDIGNALVLAFSVSVIVLGIIGSGIEQLLWLRVTLSLLGMLGIIGVLQRCKRSGDGIIPARLMARSPRIIGYAIVAILAGTSGALFYLGVLLLQDSLGMTQMQAGMAWLPFCLGFFPGLFLFQFIIKRWSSRAAALVGLTVSALGFLLFAVGVTTQSYWVGMMPAMIVTSVGFGCVSPVSQYLATFGLSEVDAGAGSGITSTIQQLFNVGGVTLLAAVAISITDGTGASTIINPKGFIVSFVLAAVAIICGAVLILVRGSALASSPDNQESLTDGRES